MHWGMGDVETESSLVFKVFSCNGKKRIEAYEGENMDSVPLSKNNFIIRFWATCVKIFPVSVLKLQVCKAC